MAEKTGKGKVRQKKPVRRTDYMKKPSTIENNPVEAQKIADQLRKMVTDYAQPGAMLRRGLYPLLEPEGAEQEIDLATIPPMGGKLFAGNIKKFKKQLLDALPESEQAAGKVNFSLMDDFTDLRTAIFHVDNAEYREALEYLSNFDRSLAESLRSIMEVFK